MDRKVWVSSRQYILSEMKVFYRDSLFCVSQSDYQNPETMNTPLHLPKWELPQDSHSGRKKKHQPQGQRISLKEMAHMSNNLLDHHTGWD